jgi:hypothetical protein
MMAMSQFRRPELAARLERVFTQPDPVTESGPPGDSLPPGTFRAPRDLKQEIATSEFFPGVQPALLESVRDNSSFRSVETAAWFHLWQQLQLATREQLDAASRGVIDYAQFVDQPQTYRGHIVTVRGTARRVEVVQPAENELGLKQMYLLTLRPPGGQIWPVRVYALEMPRGLLRGNDLRHEVQATGFFFKNWSYQWQGGLGLAPVILAREVQLLEPLTGKTTSQAATLPVAVVALSAMALALAMIAYVIWNVRHASRPNVEADQDEIVAAMQRGAGEGSP